MEYTKVFTNGGSQAVRLPKNYRFEDREVMVNRIGDLVILMPKKNPWESIVKSQSMFTEDFLADEIEDLPVQEREWL